MAADPNRTHHLDQFMALLLDVQTRLKVHKEDLIAAGWSEPEAWALCQRVEERILGPAMDLTATGSRMEARLEEFLREEAAKTLRCRRCGNPGPVLLQEVGRSPRVACGVCGNVQEAFGSPSPSGPAAPPTS